MKIFQKTFKLALVFYISVLSPVLFASHAFAQYFVITNFHSDIIVQKDSSVIVKETLDVQFERPRHGIYRELPFRYRDEFGTMVKTPIEVISVTDAFKSAWMYQVSKSNNHINIRIGNPKVFVTGVQTYVITYKVENAILFFNDHDELYWNVTGNNWKAAIQKATADVALEAGNKNKNTLSACYTGLYGSKESKCTADARYNGASFVAKRQLQTGEGLTIAFGWDKGIIYPPRAWKKFLWAVNPAENWVFLVPLISFLFMFNMWYRKGRDPKVRESVTVMYEPPKFNNKPLTPAEVGAIIDEKLDIRDITSSIVGLAVKGYIIIEEIKKEGLLLDTTDYLVRKLKKHDSSLSSFEIELMNRVFEYNSNEILVSSLKNNFYKNLHSLKQTLYEELVSKKYFPRNPENLRNNYIGIGIFIAVAGTLASVFFMPYAVGKGIAAAVFSALLVIAFGRVLPAKTKAGASAYTDILGFQEFMNRAEKDRLKRMGDKNLFSKFLPYAIALNVADNWAKAFEGIYQEPPDWYISPSGYRAFNPYVFSHSINSMGSSLSSVMVSAPRGSGGSGGGGSSGGGFGGGGGGSW